MLRSDRNLCGCLRGHAATLISGSFAPRVTIDLLRIAAARIEYLSRKAELQRLRQAARKAKGE